MNSQNHEHQKNNFKNGSKSTIVYLGILATMFVNTSFANEIAKEDQFLDQAAIVSNSDALSVSYENTLKKPEVVSETEVSLTNSILNVTNSKSIEETIEEDKKITEFQDEFFYPLILDKTIEEVIKEDYQIIESTITDQEFPLDFELINKIENALKSEVLKNTAFDKKSLKS